LPVQTKREKTKTPKSDKIIAQFLIVTVFAVTVQPENGAFVCECSTDHYKCGALICAGNKKNDGLTRDRKPQRYYSSGKECMYGISKSIVFSL